MKKQISKIHRQHHIDKTKNKKTTVNSIVQKNKIVSNSGKQKGFANSDQAVIPVILIVKNPMGDLSKMKKME